MSGGIANIDLCTSAYNKIVMERRLVEIENSIVRYVRGLSEGGDVEVLEQRLFLLDVERAKIMKELNEDQ